METDPNILAWKIPWTEEPGGLQFPGGRKQSDMTEPPDTVKLLVLEFLCGKILDK